MKMLYTLIQLLNTTPAIAEEIAQPTYTMNAPAAFNQDPFPSPVEEMAFNHNFRYNNLSLTTAAYNIQLDEKSTIEISYRFKRFQPTIIGDLSLRDFDLKPGFALETELSNLSLNVGIINLKPEPLYFAGIKIKF